MVYVENEDKNNSSKITKLIMLIVILIMIIIGLVGFIIIDKLNNEPVNCKEVCKNENPNEKDNQENTADPDEEFNDDKPQTEKPSVGSITVDTSYKISPNLKNVDLTFAGSSCELIETHLRNNNIDYKESHSITIKNIELNSENHRYKYVVDNEQNVGIEVFDSEFIATKPNSDYMLTKVCNYDNHFIAIETNKNLNSLSNIKIININGEIKMYEQNLVGIDYQNELLFLSFVNENKYKRISMNLKKDLEYQTVIEKDVDCSKIDLASSSLKPEERDIAAYCELKKKSN